MAGAIHVVTNAFWRLTHIALVNRVKELEILQRRILKTVYDYEEIIRRIQILEADREKNSQFRHKYKPLFETIFVHVESQLEHFTRLFDAQLKNLELQINNIKSLIK